MTPTQFKAKTRNFAAEKHLNPQIVQRYYMMEKLLECIVESPYHDDFVLKGGFLIGSKYGLENRSTVDIDTTYRNSKLTKEKLETVFSELTANPTKDGIRFKLKGLTETREADYYPGFQAKFIAFLENARVPFKLDITSGDSIIPAALMYEHKLMFENKTIHIPAYPTEQILAEKLHATFSFGKDNSRMKDFYDLYMIPKLERIDEKNLYKSIQGTFKERNNQSVFKHLYDQEMPQLVKDAGLREKWKRYQQENYFAKDISFESTLTSVDSLMQSIVEQETAERKQNFKRSQQMNQEMER
ncbi:nucleotidyl transferase AbiEii/AbiGii toxin family protein [Enterococcus hirae]|nr:nucleotidyl transferase AbiEii/AbiGii toxin family protein [Enterococcus hirae]